MAEKGSDIDIRWKVDTREIDEERSRGFLTPHRLDEAKHDATFSASSASTPVSCSPLLPYTFDTFKKV